MIFFWRKKHNLFFTFLIVFFSFNFLNAKYIDLGTHGKTYKISEPDFMDELKKAAKKYFGSLSPENLKKQLKEEIYKQSVGYTKLPFAKKNKKYSYLNTYTFKQDIFNPFGRIVYHKGQTITINNKIPLYLCFLKGNLPELKNEISFFNKIMKKMSYDDTKCTYIIANYSTIELSKEIPNYDFYPVRNFYEKRFKIKAYPSLVELKNNKINVYEFGIEQFKHKEEK